MLSYLGFVNMVIPSNSKNMPLAVLGHCLHHRGTTRLKHYWWISWVPVLLFGNIVLNSYWLFFHSIGGSKVIYIVVHWEITCLNKIYLRVIFLL